VSDLFLKTLLHSVSKLFSKSEVYLATFSTNGDLFCGNRYVSMDMGTSKKIHITTYSCLWKKKQLLVLLKRNRLRDIKLYSA